MLELYSFFLPHSALHPAIVSLFLITFPLLVLIVSSVVILYLQCQKEKSGPLPKISMLFLLLGQIPTILLPNLVQGMISLHSGLNSLLLGNSSLVGHLKMMNPLLDIPLSKLSVSSLLLFFAPFAYSRSRSVYQDGSHPAGIHRL